MVRFRPPHFNLVFNLDENRKREPYYNGLCYIDNFSEGHTVTLLGLCTLALGIGIMNEVLVEANFQECTIRLKAFRIAPKNHFSF